MLSVHPLSSFVINKTFRQFAGINVFCVCLFTYPYSRSLLSRALASSPNNNYNNNNNDFDTKRLFRVRTFTFSIYDDLSTIITLSKRRRVHHLVPNARFIFVLDHFSAFTTFSHPLPSLPKRYAALLSRTGHFQKSYLSYGPVSRLVVVIRKARLTTNSKD